MNNKFDELTKSVAQSVTRRGALRKFGRGLAGMAPALLRAGEQREGTKQELSSQLRLLQEQ